MNSNSPEMTEKLVDQGYCVLPAMDHAGLNTLLRFYFEHLRGQVGQDGFYRSISDIDKSRTALLNHTIKGLLMLHLRQFFSDIRPIVGSYMVKPPGAEAMAAHQDWTFVDNEPDFESYTCWMPLVDTDSENGMLGVVPGSHSEYLRPRASPSPQFPRGFPETDETYSRLRYLPLRAGEAVVFNHRVIHASLPNTSGQDRPALILAFTSFEATLVHITLSAASGKEELLKYAVDEKFFDLHSNESLSRVYASRERIEGYRIMERIPKDANR
jgi:hypothetical protein